MPLKPKLGQNFLNDAQAAERIAASLGDISGRTVVEIGPGAGAITGALAARAAHVLAVELDHELALHLRAQFPAAESLPAEPAGPHDARPAAFVPAGTCFPERLKSARHVARVHVRTPASSQRIMKAAIMPTMTKTTRIVVTTHASISAASHGRRWGGSLRQ